MKRRKVYKRLRRSGRESTRSCFPQNPTYTGYLQIQSGDRPPFVKRYFCLKNNFLISAPSPNSTKVERVIGLEGVEISRSTGSLEARHKFTITTDKKTYYFLCSTTEERRKWVLYIRRASRLSLEDIWKKTGSTFNRSETRHSKVIPAEHRETGQKVAIKIINKDLCNLTDLYNEVQALKKMEKHECVVELYDIFETRKYLHLVMELCSGGELLQRMTKRQGKPYNERECCKIMNQVARGVKHIHSHGIVHRDLKPANILCKDNASMSIRVADFGISKVLEGQEKYMKSQKGTLKYLAPEVLKEDLYDKRVDYWSLGIIMFRLFCGKLPFQGEGEAQLIRSILEDDVQLDTEEWAHISPQAKHLIKRLLSRNPDKRATIDDIIDFTSIKKNKPRSHYITTQSILGVFDINEDEGEREMCLTPSVMPCRKLRPANKGLKKISITQNDSSDVKLKYNSENKETRMSSKLIIRTDKTGEQIGNQCLSPRDFITRPEEKKLQKRSPYLSRPVTLVDLLSPTIKLVDFMTDEDYDKPLPSSRDSVIILDKPHKDEKRNSVIIISKSKPTVPFTNDDDLCTPAKLFNKCTSSLSSLKIIIPKRKCPCVRQPIDSRDDCILSHSPKKPNN